MQRSFEAAGGGEERAAKLDAAALSGR